MSAFGKGNLGETPQPVPASNPNADNISRRGHNYRLWSSLFASAVIGAMILTVVVVARQQQEAEKGISIIVPEVSPTMSVNLEAAGNSCPEGYWLSDNEFYSLCVPEGFSEEITINDSHRYPGYPDIYSTYASGDLTIIVNSSFLGGWGPSSCGGEDIFIDQVKSQITYHGDDGDCSNGYKGLIAVIGIENEEYPFPYLIELRSTNGYILSENVFKELLASFSITKNL